MNPTPPGPAPRDAKVDFFRGLALLIIFINHMPLNEVGLFTPSRFGLSDAAEIFVFCSGFVSAAVFGRCFERSGLWLGTLRVLNRCGHIYAAHIGLFVLVALVCVLGNTLFATPDYITRLNIQYFFNETQEALLALATLTYVPNYFDILPMYLVLLLWTPVLWSLARLHRLLGFLVPLGVYAAMWMFDLELPADPRSDRPWYFNPFAWQLLFFTGLAFGAGWLRVPLRRRFLGRACGLFVLLSIPLAYEPLYSRVDELMVARTLLEPLLDKTRFGLLRWVHFLALAYLAASLLARREAFLKRPLPAMLCKMGEHSLPIFLIGMTLSYIGGMVLDQAGHGVWPLLIANAGGGALLIAWAHLLGWFATKPWKNAHLAPSWIGGRPHRAACSGSACLHWYVLRPLLLGALLIPLATAPFLLIKKPLLASPPTQTAAADPATFELTGTVPDKLDGEIRPAETTDGSETTATPADSSGAPPPADQKEL